jgi:putative flavoprotein involved in K+ transport
MNHLPNTSGAAPSPSPVNASTQLLEEGAAFAAIAGRDRTASLVPPAASPNAERFEVIVVGGGQAGLSVGYHLARRGIPFVILDAETRVGDSWRQRWDSLRLFSPARFDGLDGMPFPAPPDSFPTKDEMGDYLESYAARFQLPVRSGMRVERLTREGDRYVVIAGGRRFEAPHVVVGMGTYQAPKTPAFASELSPGITQLHSADYRRPSQLPPGGVLIVGAANSGAEIAMDLRRAGHAVWVSGRSPGQVPFRVDSPIALRVIVPVLFRGIFHRLLTVDTPLGRKARPQFVYQGTPLIRTREGDLAQAGVVRVGRTEGVKDGRPVLADGTVLDVNSVVWCTGFHIGPSWIEPPVFDEHGDPVQVRGVATGEPGLYFVGPHFLYSVSSAMIHGVGRDARRVADTIATRMKSAVAA